MQWITIFLVAFVVIFLFLPKLQAASAEEGGRLIQQGAHLIDVRTMGEYPDPSTSHSTNWCPGYRTPTLEKMKPSSSSAVAATVQVQPNGFWTKWVTRQ